MHDSFLEFPERKSHPKKMFFSKYHSFGNDFILVDLERNEANVDWVDYLKNNARALCDRHRGIGADGILVLNVPGRNTLDMTVINRDQSIAQNCGNGLRCAAQHYFSRMPDKKVASIVIAGRSFFCSRADDSRIVVHMGKCEVVPKNSIKLKHGQVVRLYEVDVGNLHLVVMLNQPVSNKDELIKEIMHTVPSAKERNIGITTISDDILENYVYERGVGFTESCASGAVAAACTVAYQEMIGKKVLVQQPGGTLTVLLEKMLHTKDKGIFSANQEGEATFVFDGECALH